MIAAGFLFCPEIVLVKNYIFIKQFFECDEGKELEYVERLEKQFQYEKKEIEMSVNTWSIGDFFASDTTEKMDNVQILNQFGEILRYFWQMRVNELFPQKKINVELGMNLMGEYGLCITLYEQ